MPFQNGWKWCKQCQVLCFSGHGLGSCKANPGGGHNFDGSGNYVLFHYDPPPFLDAAPPGQDSWRWCNKCQELCYAGSATVGTCPAGGAHDHTGSGNYVMAQGQSNWKWCRKCQAMCFAGNPEAGICSEDGKPHDTTQSEDYSLQF
jgi:hypothetical protein